MSVLKQRVSERLQELGLSQSELARMAGVSPSFITDIMTERKKSVRADALLRIAAALRVEPPYLTFTSQLSHIPKQGPEAELPPDDAAVVWKAPAYDSQVPPPLALLAPFIKAEQEANWAPYLGGGTYLPVFAATGGSQTIIPGPQPHARVRRPPQLAQACGCYAVRVATDNLAPRYLKGELVYGQPERSLVGARWVIAVRKSFAGALLGLWKVKGFADTGIHLAESERGPSSLLPYAELIALHRIVLAGEDVAA